MNDPAREAVDTMRAYKYQVLASLLAWLNLGEGEVLYLEGAEDFDKIKPDGSTVVTQVKDTAASGSLTLRTSGAVEAISNYWAHRERNHGRRIHFDYLTTSVIGREQGAPFGKDIGGIELWRRAQENSEPFQRGADARRIADFLLKEEKVSSGVLSFLKTAKDDEILTELVEPIRWLSGADETAALLKQIDDRLVEFGSNRVYARDAEKALAPLYFHVWKVVSRSDERKLDRPSLFREFDAVATTTIPQSLHLALLDRVMGPGEFLPNLGDSAIFDSRESALSGRSIVSSRPLDVEAVERAFGSKSRLMLGWPQETDGHWLERPELERLRALAMQTDPTVTVLIGGPGEGKSALLARVGNQLAAKNVLLLALKADHLPRTISTLDDLDSWVGAPVPVAEALRRLAAERRVILLIDQLDALAELMDQHSARLSALLRLVDTVRGVKNLQVLLSCREFEFRNDIRLNSIKTDTVTLSRPLWEQVLPLLTARGLDPTGWSDEVRDILRTPQNLAVFLTHLATGRQSGTIAFTTYQGMLDRVVAERLERRYGARTTEAAEHIATTMAQEEELWLSRGRFERLYKEELCHLEAAEFLVFSEDGLSLSFRHQTLFDFMRVRAFLRDGVSIAEHVIKEKQESLFVRPILWSALHHIRGVDRSLYRCEFRRLWMHEELRAHLRYLLISFLGQLNEPDDEEARWLLPTLTNLDLRPRALHAMAGSHGWFSRLRGRISSLMTAPPAEAWYTAPILSKALAFGRDVVLELVERHWLSSAEYLAHALHLLDEIQVWDKRSLDLAIRIAGYPNVAAFRIRRLAEGIAKSKPELAPSVIVRHLEAQTAQIDAAPRNLPKPPPEDASEDAHLSYRIEHENAVNGQLRKLLEGSEDWYRLDEQVVQAPQAFLVRAWPWLIDILKRLGRAPREFLHMYREHQGLSFAAESNSHGHEPLPNAFEAAMRAFAEVDADAFLAFVEANKKSDLMVVHHLLAIGLELLAPGRPEVVLCYLMEDPRRFAIGDYDNFHRDSQSLIAAIVPALGRVEALRLEQAITKWPLYREIPANEDAKIRFNRRKKIREHRLLLLRAFPAEQLSTKGRRHLQEEERAMPYAQDEYTGVGLVSIGSPMSAEQMQKATDDEIVALFDRLTDSTKWDHPKRSWKNYVGGSIPASREFGAFAKLQPSRALRIIERFRPGLQERPVGATLTELGSNDVVPAEDLIGQIHALEKRGFSSTEFREDAALCLRAIARRAKGLDDTTCALLEGWLSDWTLKEPNPNEEETDSAREHQNQPGNNKKAESFLWGHGDLEKLPGGNYPFLDALMHGYLFRNNGGSNSWLAQLERHFARREDPEVWIAIARYLHYITHADHDRTIRFYTALFNRFPEILMSRAGIHLIGRVHGLLPPEVYSQILTHWVTGNWAQGPQAAGEVAALRFCLKPNETKAKEQVERFIDGADFPPKISEGLRLGVAYTLVATWNEPTLRAQTTPLMIRLVSINDKALAPVLHRIFAKADPLPPDEHTREYLMSLLGCPAILVAGSAMLVINKLNNLLREGWEPELIHAVASALIVQAGQELGDARTIHAGGNGNLVELALTLHRLPETRSRGLELFELLMTAAEYEANKRLETLDRRPFH
ncbi:ATP-binding protein [Cystobacter fuscus]|uniref:ATP-binding protein n=1 Tax=Cystobacter fuscus TaxID=43 RepID=UPI00138B0D21|nr:ATP-binding protein [Cystobacter fuscus]